MRGERTEIPLIAVLLGAAILLYPVFATTLNNYNQQKFANEYNSDVLAIPETDREEILESARAYNATLSGIPILDPWYTKVAADPGSDDYKRYEAELNQTQAMARVRVPQVGINLPVYHGTTDDVIARGAPRPTRRATTSTRST